MITGNSPIGIFDSGIGGLTVFRAVSRILPGEDIIYLGDTARVPYGTRSSETIARYSFECTDFLIKKGVKILVVACNTVSAISLAGIRERVSVPVIGVIEPGARAALAATKNGRIGVVGTEATIRSSAYVKAIKALDEGVDIFGLACPLFVPLAEEGWTDGEVARLVAERYLSSLREMEIDTIVLGCTHYPLLKDAIRAVAGEAVALVDSAETCAEYVAEHLRQTRLLATERGRLGRIQPFVTDEPEWFDGQAGLFLGEPAEQASFATLPMIELK